MFIPKAVFDKLTSVYESAINQAQAQTERGLQRVLDAKDAEVRAVISAKESQISALEAQVADLKGSVSHERQRAEAAIDILLTKHGEAGPIRNADLIRKVAEDQAAAPVAAAPAPDAAFRAVQKMMAGIGAEEDEPSHQPDEVLTVGGIR